MNVFDVLVERGFLATEEDGTVKQVTDIKIKDILQKKKIRCYIGFDPSASSFHVGNLVQIMVLAHMQRAGHCPIFVIGGGTGMVGDPSGKTEMRKLLTEKAIEENIEKQRKQFGRFIDFSNDKAILVNNADWLKPINYIEFLRDIGRHFSINRMLTAESVKQRLEKGLSFLEFNYMLLQAYDYLHLFQNHGCILQMGGDDQWGNICAGIELIRRVERKEAYGFTFPLLTTSSGAKMGKTEKGAVWLSEELLSPYEYYQFWRNTNDLDVEKFLGIFTFLPMDEVRRLGSLKDKAINEAKEVLAYEATKLNHGEEAAKTAEKTARDLFVKGQQGDDIYSIPLSEGQLKEGVSVLQLLVDLKLVPSKSEARRKIQSGGIYIGQDKKKIEDIQYSVTCDDIEDGEILLRKGKKDFAKVVVS